MKFKSFLLLAVFMLFAMAAPASIITMNTSVGNLTLELYDKDKPVTVSNFVNYVQSGRFTNLFIQRWEPNFVIQAGGYYVDTSTNQIKAVPVFGTITNEYKVGKIYSNTYGTIAMARQSGGTNSATSQWFINLNDNSFLDSVDGGFTVFGRVIYGTNVLNKFKSAPGTQGIYQVNAGGALSTLPVLNPNDPKLSDLIYVNISAPFDLSLKLAILRGDIRQLRWPTVPGLENILETTTNMPPVWTPLKSVIGDGSVTNVNDGTLKQPFQFYRVRVP